MFFNFTCSCNLNTNTSFASQLLIMSCKTTPSPRTLVCHRLSDFPCVWGLLKQLEETALLSDIGHYLHHLNQTKGDLNGPKQHYIKNGVFLIVGTRLYTCHVHSHIIIRYSLSSPCLKRFPVTSPYYNVINQQRDGL